MTETVTITPTPGLDSDGNPTSQGSPVSLTPLEIAPGNVLIRYGVGGDLTDVNFTVFLPLRVRTDPTTWTEVSTLVRTGDEIEIRGQRCVASVQVWRSQRGGRGGVAVLARARTGKAA